MTCKLVPGVALGNGAGSPRLGVRRWGCTRGWGLGAERTAARLAWPRTQAQPGIQTPQGSGQPEPEPRPGPREVGFRPPLARSRPPGPGPRALCCLLPRPPLTHRGRPWRGRRRREPAPRRAYCPSQGRSFPPCNFSAASLGPERNAPPPRVPAPAARPAPGRPREHARPAPAVPPRESPVVAPASMPVPPRAHAGPAPVAGPRARA